MIELARKRIQDKTLRPPGITKVVWRKILHTVALLNRGGGEGIEQQKPQCMLVGTPL